MGWAWASCLGWALTQRRASAGFFIALLVCFSTTTPTHAEAPEGNEKEKKVFTNYSITASCYANIPGDGRCLFRSVARGACVRSGKSPPNGILQKELADELRARGQEYGKDNPIEVLYHGYGHYDALHIPGRRGARSRL